MVFIELEEGLTVYAMMILKLMQVKEDNTEIMMLITMVNLSTNLMNLNSFQSIKEDLTQNIWEQMILMNKSNNM